MLNHLITEIWNPLFSYDFMNKALLGLIALSISAPIVGTFLTLRKMSLSGDAISHAILPGAATGYLVAGLSVPAMTIGGICAGIIVTLLSGLFSRLSRNTEDSSLAVFYLISLALGVLIISTQGSSIDILHFLFGSVFALTTDTLILLCLTATITLVTMAIIIRPLIIDTLDPLYLASVSKSGLFVHLIFMGVTVLNLVAGFQAIGTLMAVGMMIIPGISARFWSSNLITIFVISIASSLISSIAGLLISFHFDLPGSPSIIMSLGGFYLFSFIFGSRGGIVNRVFHTKHYEA